MISHHGKLERKKVEKELERYRLVVESLPDGVFTVDLEGNVTSVNNVVLSYGYKKEEVIGKSLLEFIPEKYWSMVSEHLADLAEGKSTEGEVELKTKQGIVMAEFRSSPIKKRGKIVGFQSIVRDITQQKLMEEKLKESEEKYRLVFENSPDGIITLDLMGNITSVNNVVLSYGYKKEDLTGKSFLEFVPFVSEKHRPILEKHVASITSGEIAQGEMELSTPKGRLTMWFRASPMKKREEIVGFQIILVDISRRKKMKEKLRLFSDAMKTSIDGVAVADLGGNLTFINDMFEEMWGYSFEEAIGMNAVDFWSEKDLDLIRKEVTPKTIKGGWKGELSGKRKDGSLFPVSVSSSVAKDERGKPTAMLSIFRDITDRKKAEKELKESERKLRDVIDTSPDGIVWVDTTGKITLVNRKGFEVTGFSEKDLIGKNFMDVEALTQESKEKILENFMKRLEGIDTSPYEVGLVTKNGEVLPFELSASPIYEEDKIVGIQAVFRDLRERKRAEERLRESEERLRQLIEYAPDAIYMNDLNGNFVDGNKQAEKMTGYKREELIGKNMLELGLLPEKYLPKAIESLEKNMRGQRTGPDEFELIRKGGSTVNVEISTFPVKRGGKIEVIGIARDVTKRKMMEEKLRESEEMFRDSYESIQDPVGIFVGREGRLIEYNKAFKKMSGYTDEELKDKIFLDFVHPDDQAMVLEKYRTKYPEEELPLIYEIRAVNKKGEIIPLEISVSTYKKKGRVIGIEIIHRDITERKQMEDKLRESEERLRNLYESVPDALAVYVGREGHLIEYNKAFKEWCGYIDEELKDKIFLDFVHPDDRALVLEKYRTRYSEEELPLIYEIKGVNKRGEIVPTEISVGTYKKLGRVIGIDVMHRDITERKEMERKLQEYAEHLEEMVEERTKELRESQERLIKAERLAAIGELATMVGHDLRNPLSSIQNASYYLKMKLAAPKNEKVKKMFRIVEREIEYANSIVKDLLGFSRVKEPNLKKVDLILSIQDAIAQLEFPENVTLTTKLSETQTIEADPDQLRRVFQNIALNGAQAMPDGGELTVSTRKNSDFVEVTFIDTGIGIPKENMDKLFTPLFTTKAQGVGLGLAICKKLVESHNGRIEVQSKVGEGSTFTVKLPVHQQRR